MRVSSWLAGASALVLAGCTIMAVGSEYSPTADFQGFRTFGWEPEAISPTGDARLDDDPFFDANVREAVGRQLAAKQLQPAVSEPPDLLLHYHFSVESRIDVYGLDEQLGYESYERRAAEYDAGTLVVGIADSATRRIVWRGWVMVDVTGVLDDRDRLRERINEAVRRMFERYPPAEPSVKTGAGQRMLTAPRLVFAAMTALLPTSIAAQAVLERVDKAVPVAGVVFLDLDADGVRDSGEPGIEGVAVSDQVQVVTTDRDGRYTLSARGMGWCSCPCRMATERWGPHGDRRCRRPRISDSRPGRPPRPSPSCMLPTPI
jgi:hypothetical protein